MTNKSHLLLWTFMGFVVLLLLVLLVFDPKVTGTNPMIFVDIKTGFIVIGISFGLFIGVFPQASWADRPLLRARIGWLQDMVVITGVLGTVMGMYTMGRGVTSDEAAAAIGFGMAIVLLSIIYLAILVTVLVSLERFVASRSATSAQPTIPSHPPARFRPVVGLLIAAFVGIIALLLQSATARVALLGPLISIRTIGMVVLSLIAARFIFGGRPLADTLLLPFIGIATRKTSADKMLEIARGYKRIVTLPGLIIALQIPVMSVRAAGSEAHFQPMGIGLAYIIVIIAVLLYCMLIEGLLIQHAYYTSAQLPPGDRGFIFKVVIPMFLIIFMTAVFMIILSMIL